MGDEYSISLAEFNAIFHLPVRGDTSYPPTFNFNNAWNRLSSDGSAYNPSSSKSTKLQSLTMRYIHRFIVHAIRGKGESTGVVGKPELFMLSSFLGGSSVNTGAWMLKHMISITKRPSGKLCIGGLISAIYIHYGYILDPADLTLVFGPNKIDLNTLGKMGMVAYTGEGQFVFVDAAGRPIQADEQVDPDEPGNLEGDPDVASEEDADDDLPQPSVPQSEPSSSTQPPWDMIITQLERLSADSREHTTQLERLSAESREHTTQLARMESTFSRMDDRLHSMDDHLARLARRSPPN